MDNKKFPAACLFDFDGTLVDSMSVWRDKMFNLLRLQNIEPTREILREITPLGDAGMLEYLRRRFHLTMTDEQMHREMDAYATPLYANVIPAKAGACEFLRSLKASGIGIYLLTASPQRMFAPCLERLDVLSLFDEAWSCEDFGRVKSDPAIYFEAAARMGVSVNEIAFFDDNKIAVETAKSAGLYVVGVYDETSEQDEDAIRGIADRYIKGDCWEI